MSADITPSEIAANVDAYGDASGIIAEDISADLVEQLSSLASIFDTDSTDAEFSHPPQDSFLSGGGVSGCLPSAPNISIDKGDVPVMGELNTFSMPTITIPPYTISEPPATELAYDEAVYQSDIQAALKAELLLYLKDGGIGLGAEVEAALWERKRGERELSNERAYTEVEELIASKNYCMPAGALNGLLLGLLAEQTRVDTEINLGISTEQARIARDQSEHTMNMAIASEGLEREHFNNVANRVLECAKATTKVIIDLYLAKMRGYVKRLEATKISVEAKRTEAGVIATMNEAKIEAFSADVKAYEAKLLVEVGIIETSAQLFGFKIAGCTAKARLASLELDAQIKGYQNSIDQANNETALSLQESETAIRTFLKSAQIASSAISTTSGFSSQVIASALSAINISASIGDTLHQTTRSATIDTKSSRSSSSCSEIHRYDHT